MKHIKLFLLLLICLKMEASGQNCPDTITYISTNPDAPQSNQFTASYNGLINPFVNSFNWAEFNGSIITPISINLNANWHSSINSSQLWSPFSPSVPAQYRYLSLKSDGQQAPVSAQEILEDLDWTWKRGWELMYLHTGFYPDGSEINTVNSNSILSHSFPLSMNRMPYYMLYNRYTGKLRVFAAISTEEWSSIDYLNFKIGYKISQFIESRNSSHVFIDPYFRMSTSANKQTCKTLHCKISQM